MFYVIWGGNVCEKIECARLSYIEVKKCDGSIRKSQLYSGIVKNNFYFIY